MANTNKSKEIDVVGIIKKVLSCKRLLLKYIVISAIIGVVVALNTPKEYTTTVVLAPEISGGSGITGNLGDLASMVGINFNSNGGTVDAIYPEIYPEVLASSDFIIGLFDVRLRLEKDTVKRTFYNHILQDSKIPFWAYPRIWLTNLIKSDDIENSKKVNPFHLTKEQTNIYETIRNRVSCIVDKKTGIITISIADEDRLASAIIADTIQDRLKQYITQYRTKKSRDDLEYTKRLYHEA